MAYIGQEYYDIVEVMSAIKRRTGGTPAMTLYEYGYDTTASATYVELNSWTVAGDGAVLAVYRIDPARSDASASGRLRVQVNSATIAEMSVNGTETGDNFLVGLAFDDNHQDNVSAILATNGDVVDLDAYRSAGTFYADWIYFEYDLN